MKFEKRADGGETTPAAPEPQETGKKPFVLLFQRLGPSAKQDLCTSFMQFFNFVHQITDPFIANYDG